MVKANPKINSLGHSSVCATSSRFGIAETTLRHAKNNGVPNCLGCTTVLSKHEEEQLVEYCKNMQKIGFGLMKSGVNYCVMQIVHSDNHKHSFNDQGPGKA